jgi:uncharacterized protein
MRAPFQINGVTITPGSRQTINLPVAKLYTHTEINMPVHVVHGKREGPCLFISAALHGDEINGVEIISRVLKVVSSKKLMGTILAIPMVNVYGFINRSRYLPDRRDLNRSFPGSKDGSLAGRLASLFIDQIVSRSTHGIDLHTAAVHRTNLPQIRARLTHKKTKDMAYAFGAPVILDTNLIVGSLRYTAYDKKIPLIVYEGGEALRFEEQAIRAGFRGVIAVMQHLGMVPDKKEISLPEPFIARSSYWCRAPQSGIAHFRKDLGDKISALDTLGTISDPFGKNGLPIRSPIDGIVIGKSQIPLVNKGEALFHVASFKKPSSVEKNLKEFYSTLEEGPMPFEEGLL